MFLEFLPAIVCNYGVLYLCLFLFIFTYCCIVLHFGFFEQCISEHFLPSFHEHMFEFLLHVPSNEIAKS
jgi:hypothetical protein